MSMFIKVRDVANTLGVSISTVMRMLDKGVLPAVRLYGRRRKILRKEFDEWLTSLKEMPPVETISSKQVTPMKRILNFTQHEATPQQIAEGVVEPEPCDRDKIQRAITFEELPSQSDLRRRATTCAVLAKELMAKYNCDGVMIGGAPYFMSHVESALRNFRVRFCYAFSRRESEEHIQPDGSLKKTQVFKHAGFIWGDNCE